MKSAISIYEYNSSFVNGFTKKAEGVTCFAWEIVAESELEVKNIYGKLYFWFIVFAKSIPVLEPDNWISKIAIYGVSFSIVSIDSV